MRRGRRRPARDLRGDPGHRRAPGHRVGDLLILAIGLGSSLGPRREQLELAVRKLAASPGLRLLRVSRWVRTPPLAGGTARNWFLNGVALFESELDPHVVLGRCVELEKHAGRRRVRFWGDRPLDLDLLLDGDRIVRTPDLILPHPAIGRRPFVLEPLLEVWPDAVDPTTGTAYAALPRARGPRPIPDGLLARGRRLRFV